MVVAVSRTVGRVGMVGTVDTSATATAVAGSGIADMRIVPVDMESAANRPSSNSDTS
jgi:hypothetical protein